ncbi:DUF11 domain-containing protein [Streptomyces bambusae]|uniref:CARDB domain-containing protein n=1 Tax=Streptomyces bambusae TaxID=1550616 RepID=UPI001CFE6AA7|nr:CARDB domain-containing protein [Streptomyces bambusae]MCB5168480.1 DUF11 domain-containing protein [Streptomyces bambusae]
MAEVLRVWRKARRGLGLALALVLVAAVPAVAPAPVQAVPAAAAAPGDPPPPDPGRIAYIGDGEHRSLVLAGPGAGVTPLLPVGRAGNDCQARARGDDLVWVSDRDGTGEGLYRRTGDGPAVKVWAEKGRRILHPVLSPDRRWIAFVAKDGDGDDLDRRSGYRCDDTGTGEAGDGDPAVWVIRTDGTGLRRAVADADWVDWSPDGTEFVFTRGGRAFRRTVADGGTEKPVTPPNSPAAKPVWEPSAPGTKDRIAYVTLVSRDTGDGTVTEQVLATVPASGGGSTAPVLLASGRYEWARHGVAWAPDGSTLLFLSFEPYLVPPEPRPCGLCRGEPVFDEEQDEPLSTEQVGWYTPAGGTPRIMLSGTDPESFNIESSRPHVPLDRLQLRAAQGEESDLADPAYAPDGRRLAFVSVTGQPERPATERILVGAADALAAAVPLTYPGMLPGEHQGRPAWSPDGTRLAFARWAAPDPDRPRPHAQIAVVDIAAGPDRGTLLHTLPGVPPRGSGTCDTDDRDPAWSPDGRTLAFSRWYYCNPGPIDPGSVDSAAPARRTPRVLPALTPTAVPDERDRHIWTAPAAASGVQTDLTQKQCAANDPCRVVDVRPAYRPGDTTEIAFVRQTTTYRPPRLTSLRSGYDGDRQVLVMAADGTSCRSVVPPAAGCPLRVDWPELLRYDRPDNPAWSPTGGRLAVDVRQSYGDGGRVTRLMVLDPTGANQDVLVGKTGNNQSQPTWEPSADLRLSLTTEDSPLLLGATARVTVTLWNQGIADAPGTAVRIRLPAGLTPGSPLPAGCAPDPAPGELVCTAGVLKTGTKAEWVLPLTGAALGDQPVSATATTLLPDHAPADNEARLVVIVVAADLAVTATATPPVVRINEPSQITFTVRNTGTAAATEAVLKLTLPPGLTVVTGTPCPPAGCPLGTLAPGASAALTLGVTAPGAFTGSIEGTATTATVDPDSANDTAAVDLTVVDPRMPDAAVTVTATPDRIRTGEQSTLVWTVRNRGDATARGVVLTPLLPDRVTVVTADPACPPAGCTLGELAPGASVRVERSVTAAAPLSGAVVGVVTADADADPTNNVASAVLTVDRQPPPPGVRPADPAVAVTAGPRTAYTGGRITAEVTVRNGGPAKATGLRLKVAAPAGMRVLSTTRPACLAPAGCAVPDLGPGARQPYVRLVLAADAARTGTVTAAVTTGGSDANPANNTASAAVTVRAPKLVLDPVLGPPGSVPRALGSSFPPGVTVRLVWSKGVTVAAAPVVVRADGTFSAPVLVLVQDALGDRELTASHARAGRPLFRPVRAPYLVVPGVLQPSDFQWRR